MATQLPNGQGYVGKLGGNVGMKDSQGKAVLRTYVANPANPQTTAQTRARVRFLTASGLSAGLRDQLAGFSPYARQLRITKRNAFIKAVMAATYDDNGTTKRVVEANPIFGNIVASVAYEYMPLSRGNSPLWRGAAPTVANTDISVAFGMLTVGEIMHMVAYNPDLNTAAGTVAEITAATQTILLPYPQNWSGSTVHVYAFTQSFTDAAQRIEYLSYFNGNNVLAEADITALEALGNYTASSYLGSIAVG